jgi:hypothetical protein
MIQNNPSPKALLREKPIDASDRSDRERQTRNHPVSLEAFDHERMGIAAKE